MRITTKTGFIALFALLVDCGSSSTDNVVTASTSGSGSGGSGATGSDTSSSSTTSTGSGVVGSGGGTTGTATGGTGGGPMGAGGASAGGATSGTGDSGGTGGAAGASGGLAGAGGSMDGGAPRSPDAGGARAGLDGEISAAVASVSTARIGAGINMLAGFTTRNTCSNDTSTGNSLGAARDWIRMQFQSIAGLAVSLDDFTFSGCASGTVTNQNVVAVKLGAHPDRVFVIGGHYDSRTIVSIDPTSPAPGANDSGSQTAAVLEIARALAPLQFDASLVFAAFAAEEQGLFGSAHLAKDYPMYVTPAAKVEAMISLDIVGGDNVANNAMTLQQFRVYSPGTPREFNIPMGITDDTSPSRGVMRYIGYWGSAYVPTMTMIPVLHEDRLGRGSDHQSFINAGIPGVRFIETVESANAATLASHQHSPNDLPMYVTPAYTARIAQIVAAVGASLARAPGPPQMASATGPSAGPWTLTWSAPAAVLAVDHYVIAARPTTENFYHARLSVPASKTSQSVSATDLGIAAGAAFFVSVAAVDAAGHESLFAYPEYRCDATSCAVQPGSLDVTARN